MLGPILDNKHSDLQNNINTNTASSNLNTQRLTVVDLDNVATSSTDST